MLIKLIILSILQFSILFTLSKLAYKVKLLDFIQAIEEILGEKAIYNFMPMQKGDVKATWADTSLLKNLTNYSPKTNFKEGISNFIKWYKEYYKV